MDLSTTTDAELWRDDASVEKVGETMTEVF